MGQQIVVQEKRSANPGIVRFEANRVLTGMAHERYVTLDDAAGSRPPDVLARRLLQVGGITSVHIHGNEITVNLAPGCTGEGLKSVVEGLYIHYLPGVEPSILEG